MASAFYRSLFANWTGQLFGAPTEEVAAEIDALDEPPECESCGAELSEDEIDAGDLCRFCAHEQYEELLSDADGDR